MECEVCKDGIRLEHVSEFKYFICVLDKSGTDEAECIRKAMSGRRVADVIRSLVNARSVQLECGRLLHESLLVPVLMYGNKTIIWREKERSRIRAIQMDNLRGLLDIRRMDEVSNARTRQLCRVTNGVDEKIDEGLCRSVCW